MYMERLHLFLIANNVVAEEKKQAILSACGEDTSHQCETLPDGQPKLSLISGFIVLYL